MRIEHLAAQQAETSGIQASGFGFEMNAKMYSVMIDKMYKDKTGAIMRELACNALDAHVDAGCPDKPFDIHMPSWLDKTFHIRDYGTGIPHAEFQKIYTNIGASTKESDDGQIGGYGLGSKTPFTVVDTFLVENWCGGVKTTWACFKSSGFPQVSEVGREDSNEPCGLKVSFAFADDLADDFKASLIKQLKFFTVKPVLTGDSQANWPVVPDYTGKDYFYYKDLSNRYGNGGASVLMGTVSYPFSPEDVGIGYGSHLKKLFEQPLCVVAPIGAVDVPPSRESLEMTAKTKEYVLGVLNRIQKEYQKEFEDNLNKQKTKLEAMIYLKNANTNLVKYGYNDKVVYNGGKSESTWRVLNNGSYKIPEAQEVLRYANDLKTKWRGGDGGIPVSQMEALKTNPKAYLVLIDDLGLGGIGHRKDNAVQIKNEANQVYIIKCHTETKRDLIDASCDSMIKTLHANHAITARLLSSVCGLPARAKRVPGAPKKSKPDQIFKAFSHGGNRYNSEKLSVYKPSSCETTMPTTGYYVEIKGGAILKGDFLSLGDQCDAMDFVIRHTREPVYLIRSSSMKHVPTTLKHLSVGLPEFKKRAEDLRKQEERWQTIEAALPALTLTEPVSHLARKDKEIGKLVRFKRAHNKKQIVLGYNEPFITNNTKPSGNNYVLSASDKVMIEKVTKLAKVYRSKYEVLDRVFSRVYSAEELNKVLAAFTALGI